MDNKEPQSARAAKKKNWRSDHRARAHESAHAEAAAQETFAPTDMPLVYPGAAEIVSDDYQLAKLVEQLREDGSFAYDSEFIGELTYFPKLCVIQVASHARIALIDPLAKIDLTPFWELLADPEVEKVVHAGEQDLEPVYRLIGKPAANVFDTQIAAGFVALPYPLSLSKLVHEMTGARLGKGLTFSHWDQRPLSPIQLRYAADDVRYLPAVRAEIGRRLEANAHTQWAAEECAALCESSQNRFDPQTQYLRVRGASSLQPKHLAVLRELTIWRDASARKHDVPPRTFLRDEVLLELARTPVKSTDKLARVRGLPRPVENDYGTKIVELTQQALSLPTEAMPSSPKEFELSPTERFNADALFAAAQAMCAGMAIDAGLVASRNEFGEFYRHIMQPNPTGDLPRLLQGWRRDAIGQPLVDLMRRRRTAELAWNNEALHVTWRQAP